MVTRNGRFQVSKGYSRERVKRDTDRFVEEDFYREQALRRLEQREVILQRRIDHEAPVAAETARQAQPPAARFETRAPVVDKPLVYDREPPPEVLRPRAKAPERSEPRSRPPVRRAAPPPPPAQRRPALRRQKLRLRHAPQPGWWASLWRRLFGRP